MILLTVFSFIVFYIYGERYASLNDDSHSSHNQKSTEPVLDKSKLPSGYSADKDNSDSESLNANTGRKPPPIEDAIRSSLKEMVNTSSDGLLEKTNKDSISVDLQGRFQTVPVATVDENGQVEIKDYSSIPE